MSEVKSKKKLHSDQSAERAAEKKAKVIRCVVTSDSMSKSRIGIVERLVKHARYGKYIRRKTKFMFHDEDNTSKLGDQVLIRETRPLSCRKRFMLVDVVERAKE